VSQTSRSGVTIPESPQAAQAPAFCDLLPLVPDDPAALPPFRKRSQATTAAQCPAPDFRRFSKSFSLRLLCRLVAKKTAEFPITKNRRACREGNEYDEEMFRC